MKNTIPALAALIVASALVVPTVSQAATADSAVVSYADLNLRAAAGRDVLQRRIAFAARTLCGVGRSQELVQISAASDCEDKAMASAKPAFDAAVDASRRGTVTVLDAAALIVTAQ